MGVELGLGIGLERLRAEALLEVTQQRARGLVGVRVGARVGARVGVRVGVRVGARLLSMRLALLPSSAKEGMYSEGSSKACALRTLDERFCVICTTTFCRSRSLGTVSA